MNKDIIFEQHLNNSKRLVAYMNKANYFFLEFWRPVKINYRADFEELYEDKFNKAIEFLEELHIVKKYEAYYV